MPERLKSRKFWVAVGTAAVALANDIYNLGIDEQTGIAVALVVATYLGGQSAVDAVKGKAEVNAVADFNKQQAIAFANATQAENEKLRAKIEVLEEN